MRTTLNIDSDLIAEAQRLTGMTERTALIHAGLRSLIERESARRLARLGGTQPDLVLPTRRRSELPRARPRQATRSEKRK